MSKKVNIYQITIKAFVSEGKRKISSAGIGMGYSAEEAIFKVKEVLNAQMEGRASDLKITSCKALPTDFIINSIPSKDEVSN